MKPVTRKEKHCPALTLMSQFFTGFDESKKPVCTARLVVAWTENTENLTADKARFVSVSSDTDLRNEQGKIVFDGGTVCRFKYDGVPEIPEALYVLTKSLYTRGCMAGRFVLQGDEHATIDTFVARHTGGFLLSLMGNKRHFNTGGKLKFMTVARDGRVLYGEARTDKDQKDLLSLCKAVYEGGPEAW